MLLSLLWFLLLCILIAVIIVYVIRPLLVSIGLTEPIVRAIIVLLVLIVLVTAWQGGFVPLLHRP